MGFIVRGGLKEEVGRSTQNKELDVAFEAKTEVLLRVHILKREKGMQ